MITSVDWEHPNYDYFADAMLWVRSMHMSDWRLIPVANWSKNYEETKDFLEDYPEFEEFFKCNLTGELLETMFESIYSLETNPILKRLLRKNYCSER